MLRAQVAVVYVMAGLAKLNHDWLVRGEPMADLARLADRHRRVIGPLLDEPWAGRAASWAGVAFDLTIVGWLLWRRSRPVAYVAVVVFHVVTWRLFAIGVFPWVMIASTLVFFPPDWPTRATGAISATTAPARARRRATRTAPRCGADGGSWPALAVWAALQVAVPLRHLAYPGDVRWTEEGYYGSFRVMLTEKAGWLRFEVHDPATGETWTVEPATVLTDWQERQAAARADLTLAAAHLVADEMARRGTPTSRCAAELLRVVQRPPPPALDRPDRRSRRHLPAGAGLGVRPGARSAHTGVMPSGRMLTVALAVPVVAALAVAVVALSGDDEAEPVELVSDGPRFASLSELVAASDAVVVGTVVAVSDGRLVTAPEDPDAGFRTRLVELSVERTLRGDPPTPVVVEEPAELLDGTPAVMDGMTPLAVGDAGGVVPRRRRFRRAALSRRRQRPGALRGDRRDAAAGR